MVEIILRIFDYLDDLNFIDKSVMVTLGLVSIYSLVKWLNNISEMTLKDIKIKQKSSQE